MKRWKQQLGLAILVTVLLLGGSVFPMVNSLGGRSLLHHPAYAQSINRRAIATAVYDQLPDFPLENHYVHIETGDVDLSNTLVYRLIQYHSSVQSRPMSRFDWKLTLADYMGVNEWMDEDRYPDRFLRSNPFHQDIDVIRTLNRQQRQELIQALLTVSDS